MIWTIVLNGLLLFSESLILWVFSKILNLENKTFWSAVLISSITYIVSFVVICAGLVLGHLFGSIFLALTLSLNVLISFFLLIFLVKRVYSTSFLKASIIAILTSLLLIGLALVFSILIVIIFLYMGLNPPN